MSAAWPILIGLTGSIGMGKTTTANMFREHGIPVWDADAAVHRLYSHGGAAVEGIEGLCPGAVKDGIVDRTALKSWMAADKTALKQIETIVHPLVAKDRATFLERAAEDGQSIVVLDVPLLFETGNDAFVDAILVVSATAEVQKERVMSRDGMTEAHFAKILAAQLSDEEKRARADYVIETTTLAAAESGVARVISEMTIRANTDA